MYFRICVHTDTMRLPIKLGLELGCRVSSKLPELATETLEDPGYIQRDRKSSREGIRKI